MAEKTFVWFQGWKKYLLIYALLLVVSHLVTLLLDHQIETEQKPGKSVSVRIVREDQTLADSTIQLRYEDIYTGRETNPPTIVLLPGGPEGPGVFRELIPKLSDQYRLILPYLPGYNQSGRELPDYSFETLAVYTSQLLDQLELTSVHIMGFGLGGASAIYLAHDEGTKVRSLILASSIGVQELELLGSYRLNHAVQAVELGAVWAMYNLVPHFGLLNLVDINVSYAKSHYESDQRPLRSYLSAYEKPMLILHGREDPLVPIAAAREHHRIVPQSVLKTFEADHDLLETHSDSVSSAVSHFLSDVKAGNASLRQAAPERIQKSKEPFSQVDFAKFKGAALLLIMAIIAFSTLISEDLTCIGAGLLAARGLIGFWPATFACFIGIFIGDLGLYLMGKILGRSAIKKAPFKWIITENDLKKSAYWFKKRGPVIIFITRFLPGSRMPTYFTAGVIGAGFLMFASYFLLAAMLWTPLLVGLSKLLGNELIRWFELYKGYAIWIFLAFILFMILIVKMIMPAFSYRGRRLLVSRYRRLTRWEYWSPFILYAPVFCYVLYLGIRYRCMTLFTAANPAIENGGFVGESKSAILDLFNHSRLVADYRVIPTDLKQDQQVGQARQFMKEHELTYPVALKPDVGQRGQGVEIIRSDKALQSYFEQTKRDIIIQEYIGGKEYGVFYYRKPDRSKGDIFSITTKKLICVEGDGKRTLEELILDDEQAVNMAPVHLQKNKDRLYKVPPEGKAVPIVELGTHAKGAIFRDGRDLITPDLVNAMDEICNSVTGFYFGRFDLKVPDEDHLKKGEQIKIIEVNGVTSEATNIYDPEYSFIDAQKILYRQWKLVFEIGHQNRKSGTDTTPVWPFLEAVGKALIKLRQTS